MDSIGGMLNPIGKMPKTHYKKEFCNGILMETIGISVMVYIELLLFYFSSFFFTYYMLKKQVRCAPCCRTKNVNKVECPN